MMYSSELPPSRRLSAPPQYTPPRHATPSLPARLPRSGARQRRQVWKIRALMIIVAGVSDFMRRGAEGGRGTRKHAEAESTGVNLARSLDEGRRESEKTGENYFTKMCPENSI